MSKKPTIAELQQKIGELTEALQRERADAENLRRRTQEEKSKLGEFYKAMVVGEILPIIDNCERLLNHISALSEERPLGEGAEKIVKQSHRVLEGLGVKRIKTVGEVFDPRLHEAVHLEDGDGTVEVVCEELQPGYTLGDEVIRHAMFKVKMSKGKEK